MTAVIDHDVRRAALRRRLLRAWPERARDGRALREARYRRAQPEERPGPERVLFLARDVPLWERWRGVTAAALALAVFLAFANLWPRPDDGFAPAAAAPELTTVVQPEVARAVSGGRGRTTATLAPVVAASAPPTPQPTQAPSAAPTTAPRTGAPAATVAPGGAAGGQPGGVPGGVPSGTPGGVVGGVPGATGRATPSPSPTVNVLPLNPPPLAAGTDRFLFRVIDSRTGRPLEDVCVIYGTLTCGPNDPHTNLNGYFWLDLVPPAASNWGFRFSKDGYVSVTINRTYRARMGTVVTTVDMRRR